MPEATTLDRLKAGEIAKQELPKNPVAAALLKAQSAMKAVLPKHITPERMSRMALGILRTNNSLAAAAKKNPDSFAHAVVQAGQFGLEIGAFGEAHLVPFGDEVTLIPGYQGLVKLAKNSGHVIDIYAHEVREHDKFKLVYGLSRDLQHEPLAERGFPASPEKRGEIVGVYAVAIYRDQTRTFWALSLADVLKTRDDSRGYKAAKARRKEHPWDTHFEAMARKTAVRALCNWLPKSPEMSAALAFDHAHDRGNRVIMDVDYTIDETPIAGEDGGAGGNETSGATGGTDPRAGEANAATSDTTGRAGGTVDTQTGEIKPGDQAGSQVGGEGPGDEEIVALIKKGAYDDARALGDTPARREMIEGMIKSHQGNQAPSETTTRARRRGGDSNIKAD